MEPEECADCGASMDDALARERRNTDARMQCADCGKEAAAHWSKDNQRRFVTDMVAAGRRVRTCSPRNAYGKECPGVVVESWSEELAVLRATTVYVERDNLGHDTIVYVR